LIEVFAVFVLVLGVVRVVVDGLLDEFGGDLDFGGLLSDCGF
jgi:hypothetical protein